jgi:predicted nucleotidyltransferase component of viral defense system
MKLNLYNKLKKTKQKNIGLLQDEVIDILYNLFPDLIFHGGTCIWRCYNGQRFSEDLDFYLKRQDNIKEKLNKALLSKNLKLIKFKMTENVIFSKISDNKEIIRFEARLLDSNDIIFSKKHICEYYRMDGSCIIIYALSIFDLILEKSKAFINRKLIRDIYDVFFLSSQIKNDDVDVNFKRNINNLIKEFTDPLDEKNLRTLVYSGIIPGYKSMLNIIKNRFK